MKIGKRKINNIGTAMFGNVSDVLLNFLTSINQDFMFFGEGGATQAITSKPIKLDDIVDISTCK